MQIQVKKLDNSEGIIISKKILEEAFIMENDILEICVSDGKITILKIEGSLSLEERAAMFGGVIKVHEEFDWGVLEKGEYWL